MGTVTVTGPGSSWINGPTDGLSVGSFGTGTLTIANGGKFINILAGDDTNIGRFASSTGTVTVTGAGSSWSSTPTLNIGNFGTGTLTIADGGVVNVVGPIVIARFAGASGTLNIGAGAVTRHAHYAEPRIWSRQRYAQLQSHVRQLRVCAPHQRRRHRFCQCARRHHHADSRQHLYRPHECERRHALGERLDRAVGSDHGECRRHARRQRHRRPHRDHRRHAVAGQFDRHHHGQRQPRPSTPPRPTASRYRRPRPTAPMSPAQRHSPARCRPCRCPAASPPRPTPSSTPQAASAALRSAA